MNILYTTISCMYTKCSISYNIVYCIILHTFTYYLLRYISYVILWSMYTLCAFWLFNIAMDNGPFKDNWYINEQQAAKALRSTLPRLQPSPPRYSSRQHPRRPGGMEWNILEPLSRWLKNVENTGKMARRKPGHKKKEEWIIGVWGLPSTSGCMSWVYPRYGKYKWNFSCSAHSRS